MVSMDYLSADNCVFDVSDIQVVFDHSLHCMQRHIVSLVPNGVSNPLDYSLRDHNCLPAFPSRANIYWAYQ